LNRSKTTPQTAWRGLPPIFIPASAERFVVLYYQVSRDGKKRVIADTGQGRYDLTSARAELRSYTDLVVAADVGDRETDELARRLAEDADTVGEEFGDRIERPLIPAEVWAAGVTYKISEEARENESEMPDSYLDVYSADRPEVFFKATPERTVGHGDAVGIRGDSEWDVPEPELGLVLYHGEIVGYTVGNDVSSRDLEGQNPLYLPQAKVYDRCCAIGPCVASTAHVDDPHRLRMSMEIRRDGGKVFSDATSTGEMVRSCEELARAYGQHNYVPRFSVLLTGTALVPPDGFTLRPDDEITITIEDIGTLENGVVEV